MSTISTEVVNRTLVIKLNRGTTNAVNLDLLRELGRTLDDSASDDSLSAVLLTSPNEKFFSIGFDIPWLIDLSKDDFSIFFRTFNRLSLKLFTFPKPTLASIPGHAVAGGCILALCCDYRFITEGHKLMGLNEIKLGVPIPYPSDCILRHLVSTRYVREMLDTGDFYPPERLIQMGLVDRVFPQEALYAQSLDWVTRLGNQPAHAYAMIKENRVAPVERQILERLEERERIFISLWYADDVRRRLREAMERF
ncbi:MAG: enoyl-CoA hydratase/isomerase family protein [Candidatus Eisenbacteria bacterium]|uniref:Enoyl-CoA hydratase/isomerase family protein n=1 Tax=Eiseniibacteriota bacterium TaxID=2212470 RepID=A0A948RYB0_UNCEI|nr:enoyl-CoA hydratase/isomerase family protein [Candidatus Eisenbacteria bacterium]MBU1950687.1 enoyl-CoA hydratase/isomerase family protein [Candidatus Eisenbacteria bacterium]MBU2693258.1 enoyl-CoA hydratase/isomerase family protein [Candidatus Eisenbacteria bacterium]